MPDRSDRYTPGHYAVELDQSPTSKGGRGFMILIGSLLLLLLFLFAFLLFGPGGDVLNFFDVFLPGDPTFGVVRPPEGDVVIFGDGVVGRRLPDGNRPSCEQAILMQGKQSNSIFDVFFDVFFWANKTRLIVGSAPLCDGDPGGIAGGACNQGCDPNGSTCDPGLSCVQEPDGGYVCFGGTDSTGEVCGNGASQPTGDGTCNQPCSPTASNCNPGLSCVTEPDGGYVCWGGTDSTGETCAQQPSQTQPPGDGACVCNNRDYVCTKPDGSTTVSYNAVECDGSGVCECREPNKTWACPDGTYADFNPQCGVGGGVTPVGPTCTCVQVDPQCSPAPQCKFVCKENPGKSCTP